MARTKKLPPGHIRARMEIVIEGPMKEATKQLARVIKAFPREDRIKAVRQVEKRLREQARQTRSK